eukprot:1082199-Pelagomonas_calceolata.AAC.2
MVRSKSRQALEYNLTVPGHMHTKTVSYTDSENKQDRANVYRVIEGAAAAGVREHATSAADRLTVTDWLSVRAYHVCEC